MELIHHRNFASTFLPYLRRHRLRNSSSPFLGTPLTSPTSHSSLRNSAATPSRSHRTPLLVTQSGAIVSLAKAQSRTQQTLLAIPRANPPLNFARKPLWTCLRGRHSVFVPVTFCLFLATVRRSRRRNCDNAYLHRMTSIGIFASTLIAPMLNRRRFLPPSAATAAATPSFSLAQQPHKTENLPPAIAALTSRRSEAIPITLAEREQRLDPARALMRQTKINATAIATGTSLTYFPGLRWGQSERFFAWTLP